MVYIGLEHCRHSVADYRVFFGCRVFSISFFMYSAREMAENGQTTGRVAKPGKPGRSSENCFQFCDVSVDLSVYIASLQVLKWNNLKLHKI